MKQYISTRDLYEANVRALESGTLLAQNRTEDSEPIYRDDRGFRCAIGVAMSDATLDELRGYGVLTDPIDDVVHRGHLCVEDIKVASALQEIHDLWLECDGGASAECLSAYSRDLIGYVPDEIDEAVYRAALARVGGRALEKDVAYLQEEKPREPRVRIADDFDAITARLVD